ncbi:MAG: citrate lyase acyl carrier protein [Liquorilactobacillus hordei]|uniref:citrate lyase acyl carrier protein n=1 Tax=Liquorilactobacillus hordei TaxID=468911 RepID=UPI001CBFBD4B|nr:citrate lyase acyl carrier protein [Liquorilactobacillus hordei]MBZ2405994.1 citrate lyase acyl carrier protein [Liquorilactobacillus hordei]
MEIKKTAIAGTLESSDVQIMLSSGSNGFEFQLESDVAKQFGDQIKETITNVLKMYDIKNAKIKVVDKGALDLVIKARAIAVVQRALDIVDAPKWEVLK